MRSGRAVFIVPGCVHGRLAPDGGCVSSRPADTLRGEESQVMGALVSSVMNAAPGTPFRRARLYCMVGVSITKWVYCLDGGKSSRCGSCDDALLSFHLELDATPPPLLAGSNLLVPHDRYRAGTCLLSFSSVGGAISWRDRECRHESCGAGRHRGSDVGGFQRRLAASTGHRSLSRADAGVGRNCG
jgi:hypothetical protein